MKRMMVLSALVMTSMTGCFGDNFGYNLAVTAGDTFVGAVTTDIAARVIAILFGTPAA